MSIPDPAVLNLNLPSTGSWSQELQLLTVPDRQPIKLRGYSFISEAWDVAGQTLLTPITVQVVDSQQGRIALALSSAAVASLPAESRWELLVVQPSGVKRLWLLGALHTLDPSASVFTVDVYVEGVFV